MNPQMNEGLALMKKGLGAAKMGQRVFRWGGKLKKLPPLRKKTAEKAAAKAVKKAAKKQQGSQRKERRQRRRRILWQEAKSMGRIFFAMRKRYF